MRFWFSGELQRDIAKAFDTISGEIEARLNSELGSISYSPNLEEFAYLSIIMETEVQQFGEVSKYHKKSKSAEFRMKINYLTFKSADSEEKKSLFKKSLMRAAFMIGDLKIKELNSKKLLSDMDKVLHSI